MPKKEQAKQLATAFRNWANDTPLRIRGWIMWFVAFILACIGIGIWLSSHFPPLIVWICFVILIASIILLSFMPYYKRERDKVSSTMKNIADIESFMVKGTNFLATFAQNRKVDDQDKKDLVSWINNVADFLEKNIPGEYIEWNYHIVKNMIIVELIDYPNAITQAMERLASIKKSLRNI